MLKSPESFFFKTSDRSLYLIKYDKECALAHSRAEARLLRQPSAFAPSAHPRGAFLYDRTHFLSYRKSRMHFVLCMRQVSDYILFWLPDRLLLLQHFDRCLHLIIPLQRNIVLPDEILIQLLFHRYIRGQTFFMKIMSGRSIVVGGGDLDC